MKEKLRKRRAGRTTATIKRMRVDRICIHRTPQHIYAQVVSPEGVVVAQASTLDKEIRGQLKKSGNVEAAKQVGSLLAQRAKAKKVTNVAFDRRGFKYHGRVKALAEGARDGGMEF